MCVILSWLCRTTLVLLVLFLGSKRGVLVGAAAAAAHRGTQHGDGTVLCSWCALLLVVLIMNTARCHTVMSLHKQAQAQAAHHKSHVTQGVKPKQTLCSKHAPLPQRCWWQEWAALHTPSWVAGSRHTHTHTLRSAGASKQSCSDDGHHCGACVSRARSGGKRGWQL